jgi:signal peptidase I
MERPRLYDRGQIVVLEKPGDPRRLLVKRIVAMYPDQINLRGGRLYVNGRRSAPPEGEGPPSTYDDEQWTLARDQVFVVGDNRPDSEDSRDFGPVALDALHGVVTYRVVSLFNWAPVK